MNEKCRLQLQREHIHIYWLLARLIDRKKYKFKPFFFYTLSRATLAVIWCCVCVQKHKHNTYKHTHLSVENEHFNFWYFNLILFLYIYLRFISVICGLLLVFWYFHLQYVQNLSTSSTTSRNSLIHYPNMVKTEIDTQTHAHTTSSTTKAPLSVLQSKHFDLLLAAAYILDDITDRKQEANKGFLNFCVWPPMTQRMLNLGNKHGSGRYDLFFTHKLFFCNSSDDLIHYW